MRFKRWSGPSWFLREIKRNFMLESINIIKNKHIRWSELNTAYNKKSGAEVKHDPRNYLGIGIVVLGEVIIIWWLLSQLITVFSS
jgi:hypothetical protein